MIRHKMGKSTALVQILGGATVYLLSCSRPLREVYLQVSRIHTTIPFDGGHTGRMFCLVLNLEPIHNPSPQVRTRLLLLERWMAMTSLLDGNNFF